MDLPLLPGGGGKGSQDRAPGLQPLGAALVPDQEGRGVAIALVTVMETVKRTMFEVDWAPAALLPARIDSSRNRTPSKVRADVPIASAG